MIAVVYVGVALRRPPRTEAWIRTLVEADTETEAQLIACQMACATRGVVMPTECELIEILEI